MDILKILQKKRNEEFLKEDEIRSIDVEGRSPFFNRPPRFERLREPVIAAPDEPIDFYVEPTVSNEPLADFMPLSELPKPETSVSVKFESDLTDKFTRRMVNPAIVNDRVVAIADPQSVYCEQYRKLRTHFLQTAKKRNLTTAVVASFGPSEGKTVTALNLAWLLAQVKGLRVLIVDADLRKSSLASYLGIEPEVGLADVLTGTAALKDAIIHFEPAGLAVLPSGECRTDVAELISGEAFRDFLSKAGTMFDVILFDVPPIGLFTDASAVINQTDGVVVVACANKTSCKDMTELMQTLPADKIVAGVLNRAEQRSSDKYRLYGEY